MAPENLEWDLDYDHRIAVAYGTDGDWLVCHAFGPAANGVFGRVGFHIQPIDHATNLADAVQALSAQWTKQRPTHPLGTRDLRDALSSTELLNEARRQLETVVALMATPPKVERVAKRGRRSDAFPVAELARVVIRYDQLLRDGRPRARQRLAEEEQQSESTVQNWIRAATAEHDLWVTSGRGHAGQPTALAFELAGQPAPPPRSGESRSSAASAAVRSGLTPSDDT
jgi:hypothetical protein